MIALLYCHAIRLDSVREVLTHHPDAAESLSDDTIVLLCRLANVANKLSRMKLEFEV